MPARYKILAQGGYLDTVTNTAIPNDPQNRDYQAVQDWITEGNTPDPADAVDLWDQGRASRNALLSASDYTQAPDSPLTMEKKAEWAVYRQSLRDLPQTYPDYNTVVWPTEPS